MASAIDVAKYFVRKGYAGEEFEPVCPMRVQKLLYYAQAHSLVLRGKPVFEESIQAWQHGPVVPEVYNTFQCCGGSFIPIPENEVEISEVELKFLDMVWDNFVQFSATGLSRMTHEEKPWINARAGLKPDQRGHKEITHHDLKEYFTEDLNHKEEDLDAVQAYWEGMDDLQEGRSYTLKQLHEERKLREAV